MSILGSSVYGVLVSMTWFRRYDIRYRMKHAILQYQRIVVLKNHYLVTGNNIIIQERL